MVALYGLPGYIQCRARARYHVFHSLCCVFLIAKPLKQLIPFHSHWFSYESPCSDGVRGYAWVSYGGAVVVLTFDRYLTIYFDCSMSMG